MYKLQQDNSEKLTIKISKNDLEYELKRFFNWRTATKKYKSISDRFFSSRFAQLRQIHQTLLSKWLREILKGE
ncbi:hypothetical protein EOQ17_12935 [Staphylococcus pseudintermedius]|nr:hypothetical protein [Staphylococcus pseudintermedius]EII2700888.1 hypothetical protein [Staphylococcus pseudintermedius]MDF0069228.1 hypothetical protein [Staphylococcus pseudintermedius]MDF0081350.1 hypothetical protein [Staphylococcus pseudintermedius]HCA7520354.1 hypothetical protein [Staphylococcus pseudintermedius]